MRNSLPVTHRYRQIWANVSHWVEALDEAINYDPHEPIIRNLMRMEARLDRLEKLQLGPHKAPNNQELEVYNVD